MYKTLALLLYTTLLLFSQNMYAREIDIPVNVDSRIKTMIYNPNEIYTLNLKMGFQTIVEFSIDESVELISIGDPYPWKLTPIDRRLFIKPLQVGVRTNLTVISNKRTYLFDIKSDSMSSEDDIDVIHVVRFFYPKTPLDKSKYSFDNYLAYKSGERIDNVNNGNHLTNERVENTTLNRRSENTKHGSKKIAVNLNYSFTGEYTELTPVEVFDDRKDTFIRFKNNTKKYKIYSISESGRRKLLKQKTTGDFVIIPGVHAKLHIKNGIYENYLYNDLRVNKNNDL